MSPSSPPEPLLAGAARRVVTPRGPVDLSGFAARTQPSTGVLDDIFVRALVLRQGARSAALCSLDVLGLEPGHVRALRAGLACDGFAPEALIFCCTHTHGAPAVQHLRGCGEPSPAFVEMLLRETVRCVRDAAARLEECEALAGSAQCGLNVNRRRPGAEGLRLEANPQGARDPAVTALEFRRKRDGETVATVFNYACHAVVLGPENRKVTGDWPGEVCRRLEAERGGVCLFLQGCCGDLNPRLRGGLAELDEAAGMVALEVSAALSAASTVREPRLKVWSRTVSLPLLPAPPAEEIAARLQEIRSKPPEARDYADLRDLAWGEAVLTDPAAARREALTVEVGEMLLGDAAIAWLPGEAFCETGLALRRMRPGVRLLAAGYANGNIGYIPTEEAFREGGYEVTDAWRYYGHQMIGPSSARLLLEAFAAPPDRAC